MQIEASDLPLERAYHWEKQQGSSIYLTQPMGGGSVRNFTWSEALDESRRMAAHLQSLGFAPGAKIAILAKNSAHFILADLAIWMAGYVSVALYPTLNGETIRFILEHSESKLLFVGKLDTWSEQASAIPAGMPCIAFPLSPKTDFPLWDDIVKKTQPVAGSPVRGGDETAILVYTSGSTGRPKGVEHTFNSMSVAGQGIAVTLHVTTRDRLISYLPLAHVFERAAVEIASISNGCRVFFAESLDTFVADMQRARPTIFHSVPRLWLKFQSGVYSKMPPRRLNRLLRIPILSRLIKKKILKGLGLDRTRAAISGSAPIPPELIEWYQSLGLELLEGYAMSENFAYSHMSLPGRSRAGYVGHALPGVSHRISPEGEILVKSPGDMKSYYKDPELTRASYTEDGFLKTGDRGEIDSDGRLKITGRVKELFKTSKGKYVSPAPIENLINADSHIEMSCVTGSGLPAPFALVQLSEGLRKKVKDGSADKPHLEQVLSRLLTEVNAQVEEFERLGFLVVAKDEWSIENDLLTPTMKLKRGPVEDRYVPKIETWEAAKRKVIWES